MLVGLAAGARQSLSVQGDDEGDVGEIPRRQTVQCLEWEDLEIPAEDLFVGGRMQVYENISASKYLKVYLKSSKVIFTATHFVGHIPLNDHVALDVLPRFDVSNLTRLLRIAKHSPLPLETYVRAYLADKEHLPSLFDELAAAFIYALEEVVHTGILATYARTIDDTSFPRGRLLVNATVRRHHARGMPFRATAAWHEKTLDNPPNQLLKYTMWLLDRRFAGGTPRKGIVKLRTTLNRYYRLFRKVRLDHSRTFLRDVQVLDPQRLPLNRGYYAHSLQLASLLVRENSLDLGKPGGTIRAPSMLVNLQEAFEAYLRNSLSDAFAAQSVPLLVLDGNNAPPAGASKGLFDGPDSRLATPDIVVQAPDTGRASLLVEIKYKDRADRTDLNQAIAYGASYRCPLVILAHARGRGDPAHLRLEGAIGKMQVFTYAFDLAGDLEEEERRFADTVKQLITIPGTGAAATEGPALATV
jgi:5-methylcytosine-specific restriction enzyme subunit McrC